MAQDRKSNGMAESTPIEAGLKKRMLEQMLLIRRFEERAAVAYGLRKFGGFCHLYIGQEAVGAGAISALDLKKDYVITAYRDHEICLRCEPGAGHALREGAELPGFVVGNQGARPATAERREHRQRAFGDAGF